MWRSDDPDTDREAVKTIAKLAVDFADVNELPPAVVYGEGPTDPNGLIPLLTAVFHLGRACGARGVYAEITDQEAMLPEPRLGRPISLRLRKMAVH
jgi:hypothetical protein